MKLDKIKKILEQSDKVSTTLSDKQLRRNADLKTDGLYSSNGRVMGLRAKEERFGIFSSDEARKEYARSGGLAVIDELNKKNKLNDHWRKLGNSKIGVTRDEETKKKIKQGSSHSWRAISQFGKDGNWIRDWDNFTDIEEVLSKELNRPVLKQPIWMVCNNKPRCKTAYGFIWKYKNNH